MREHGIKNGNSICDSVSLNCHVPVEYLITVWKRVGAVQYWICVYLFPFPDLENGIIHVDRLKVTK